METESLKPNFESEEQKNKFEYQGLVSQYFSQFQEIQKIERRSGKALPDPETQALTLFLDKERHQTHLRLLELGSKLGKNKADVLIDILSKEGNLKEYGLPEFTVRSNEFLYEEREKLRDNEVLLIFDYTTADEGGALIYSEDHEERIKRAKSLAEEIDGRFLSIDEGSYHESTETIGVAFPKENLEKVAAIIRDNPQKFRLDEEFYKK